MPTETLPTVKLDTFEGPFDLLIELARNRKIDLTNVSLRAVTDDFLAYIEKESLSVRLQADFLIVAATLMLLKIRQLLPKLTEEEEKEIETLTDRVRMYELYRRKAMSFITRWGTARLLPAHFWGKHDQTQVLPMTYPAISAQELGDAFRRVTQRIPKPPQPRAHLTVRGRTLQEWLRVFTDRLHRAQSLVFQDMVHGSTRQDAAISFLAVLEMARNKQVVLSQESTFSTLTIEKNNDERNKKN